MNKYVVVFLILVFISSCRNAIQQETDKTQLSMEYMVTIPDLNSHYLQIDLLCSGMTDTCTYLKMPVWAPGYYMIMDYPKNVVDFTATDLQGNKLVWTKKEKNGWVVYNDSLSTMKISYRVWADAHSVAESYVDSTGLFLAPNGVFMYPDGKVNNPVTLTMASVKPWSFISTGMNLVEGKTQTYYADNFDVLYDSPLYYGNQTIAHFDLNGYPYEVAIIDTGKINVPLFVEDLKNIVSTTTDLMKEVPYKNYCFIMMGAGGGGLEHTNSQAVFLGGNPDRSNHKGYRSLLSFLAHEYFHLYNVKTIRPIELGPFDYDRENYTNLLWVSEGFTVYYEYIILNRAGLMTADEILADMSETIQGFENGEGKLHMTLARSSYDIWLNFFNRNANYKSTSISYYTKGPIIALLLDLAIRQATGNKVSSDDVMRFLYNRYYKELQRGFTEQEFRQVCEQFANQSLDEVFDYVYTTKEVDYQKYLNYAGVEIDLTPLDNQEENATVIKRCYEMKRKATLDSLQTAIFMSVFGQPVVQ